MSDLSQALDCFDHSLLVAKLHWYGLSPLSRKFIFSYFSNRRHRAKIKKECFSNRLRTEYGIPQGSTLGRLLFNMNSINMFYESEDSDIRNYGDDATPYDCASYIDTVVSELQVTAAVSTIRRKQTLKNATFFWASKFREKLILVEPY